MKPLPDAPRVFPTHPASWRPGLAAIALLVVVAMSATGCFRSRHEVKQLDDAAALVFVGRTAGCEATVSTDGREVLRLDEIRSGERVPIAPGVHVVTVRRDGRVVAEREVFVDHRASFEIRVP